ncbi:hypothetical protein CRUP_033540, partial [Coryphaenoides rupestris]
IKEGLLLKQTSSFQRWKKRYFKLRGRTLYYAKDAKSRVCWRVLSVCWSVPPQHGTPPPLAAGGSEEGLVTT